MKQNKLSGVVASGTPVAASVAPVTASVAPWEDRVVGYGQQAVFATLFGFFTSAQGKMLLMEHPEAFLHQLPLQVILFPLAAALELVELGMAIKGVCDARNNGSAGTDEYLQLLVTSIKTIAVITAIGIGLSATIAGAAAAPAIVPILFTIALGTNTFNNLARTFYHLGAMNVATDDNIKALHLEKMHKHLIGTVSGAMLLSAIVGLFVLGVSSGVGLAVLSGVGLAAIAISLIMPHMLSAQATSAAPSANSVPDGLLGNVASLAAGKQGELELGSGSRSRSRSSLGTNSHFKQPTSNIGAEHDSICRFLI